MVLMETELTVFHSEAWIVRVLMLSAVIFTYFTLVVLGGITMFHSNSINTNLTSELK